LNATHDTYTLLRAFVDELARCGMTDACTSPGSRSTPLVLSLVREERLRCHSHIDERCAGFFGLGVAKASGRPVALVCTSGTAAAHFAPAVIEAREARVPLIVLTADRPPELRDVGAGQTIDQLKLFGDAVKWFVEVGVYEATPATMRWIRTLACRAYWTALDGRPGPVHLNFPFREPLVPVGEAGPEPPGRADGAPWVARPTVPSSRTSAVETLGSRVAGASRGVVVAGRWERRRDFGPAVSDFAATAGFPLLGDPLSGARSGDAAIAHYDALLRDERFAGRHTPDLVLRVGDLPTSKPLRSWLAGLEDVQQIILDPEQSWQDPAGVVVLSVSADAAEVLPAVAAEAQGDPVWLEAWRAADAAAARALGRELDDLIDLSEPRIAVELAAALPPSATLVVASSMPVRDVEGFWPVLAEPPRVLSNRGANGIDGTVSTAFGVAAQAAADRGDPVVALVGDVALAHDIGGLLAARRLGLSLTIVLLNNDGGGIFDFLPVSVLRDIYEQHVATPHGLGFEHAAALYGLTYEQPGDVAQFRAALGAALDRDGSTLIEIHTSRAANVELHQRVSDAVSAAAGAMPD
jgi:2-succinyl-5-enolpyruvyl-6-hydroxy-3-cyclohexene-1-carboxylate synthase